MEDKNKWRLYNYLEEERYLEKHIDFDIVEHNAANVLKYDYKLLAI